jgi:hypothetical protein
MISPRFVFGIAILMVSMLPVHAQLPTSIAETKKLVLEGKWYIVGACFDEQTNENDYFTSGSPPDGFYYQMKSSRNGDVGREGAIQALWNVVTPTHIKLRNWHTEEDIGFIDIIKVIGRVQQAGSGAPRIQMQVKVMGKLLAYDNVLQSCIKETARLGIVRDPTKNTFKTETQNTPERASNVPNTPYVRAVQECLPNNEIVKFGPLFKRGEALISDVLMRGAAGNETVRAVFQQAEDDKKLYLVEVSGGTTIGKTCNTLVRK